MRNRIYLSDDSQISRLFWLLASPVGRACSLAEVQRALDELETTRDMDPTGEEYKKANQRVRKAISKLRAAIEEGGAADHLLIVRGGNTKYPEYSMVLRFGASAHGKKWSLTSSMSPAANRTAVWPPRPLAMR